jgi:hypothetical protein
VHIIDLQKAVAIRPDIYESGLKTWFDPRDTSAINVTFGFLANV